jgi:hypothetical protein
MEPRHFRKLYRTSNDLQSDPHLFLGFKPKTEMLKSHTLHFVSWAAMLAQISDAISAKNHQLTVSQ